MVTTPSSTSTLSQSVSSTTKDLVELNTNTQLPIKLNSTNYPAWHRQIHSLLVAHNLDGYITGETPCPSPKIKNTNDGSETAILNLIFGFVKTNIFTSLYLVLAMKKLVL